MNVDFYNAGGADEWTKGGVKLESRLSMGVEAQCQDYP